MQNGREITRLSIVKMISAKNSSSFLSEARDDDVVDFTDYGNPFVSGHSLSLRCHFWYSPNMSRLGVNTNRDNLCVYVKTDHVPQFFASGLVPDKFVLVTHNSDFVIDISCSKYLEDSRLILWLAMNKGFDHPKLKSIIDGVQNPCYTYGNPRLLLAVEEALGDGNELFHGYKSKMFFACYTIGSRIKIRSECAAVCQPQGIVLHGRMPYINYLAEISSSMFVLCPAGSGIDSCRPWEALYLRAIPIMTPSFTAAEHADWPMAVVNEWTENAFNTRQFSMDRYKSLWRDFDPSEVHTDKYCKRLNRLYGVGL